MAAGIRDLADRSEAQSQSGIESELQTAGLSPVLLPAAGPHHAPRVESGSQPEPRP